MKIRIAVGLSGRMDSAVAAALLKSQGYEVHGVHFRIRAPGFAARCVPRPEAEVALTALCKKLDIPLHFVDASERFEAEVTDPFVNARLQGLYDSPCLRCHCKIELGFLLEQANALGCEMIATGHYAQVTPDLNEKIARLQRASDSASDQSYQLFDTPQSILTRTLMPIGGLSRAMVRKLANQFELSSIVAGEAAPKVCMFGGEETAAFLNGRFTREISPAGVVKRSDGVVIGDHQGVFIHNVGDTLALGGRSGNEITLYVLGHQPQEHAVIVGQEAELMGRQAVAVHATWIRRFDRLRSMHCLVKLRPEAPLVNAHLFFFQNNMIRIEFEEPQRALAPGQPIVFYEESEVLGGAYISSTVFLSAPVVTPKPGTRAPGHSPS